MTPDMLHALRDPAGVPAHPLVFLILGVITFALHMAAVNVMLGTGALTLRGAFSANAHWRRLAVAMLTTSKIAVSVAIVLGVAPLLFVQVVYDPFWYTSNVLSAWWVMGFIALLIAGYIALYIFYWKNHDIEAEGGKGSVWLVLSLALLLAADGLALAAPAAHRRRAARGGSCVTRSPRAHGLRSRRSGRTARAASRRRQRGRRRPSGRAAPGSGRRR